MKNTKRLCLLLALVLMFTLTLAACSGGAEDGGGQDTQQSSGQETTQGGSDGGSTDSTGGGDKTLTVGTLMASDNFDPTTSSSNPTLSLVYDSILMREPETGEVIGGLAESWEFNDDSTELTLHFRDSVSFTNGEPVTAADALYSLKRFATNDQFYTDSGFDNIDFDACTVDGNDLTLVLREATPLIIDQLADCKWAAVLCQSYVEANPDSFWDAPVGSGPFILEANEAGSHYAFTRNDDYWQGPADFSEVTFYIYGDATTMFIDFENGDLDIANNVSASDADRLIAGEVDAQYVCINTNDINYLSLPWYTPELDDIRVREAISLSLDVAGITKSAFGSLAVAADSVGMPSLPYYVSQGKHERNIDRAKELMAEAGYPDGGLSFNIVIFNMPEKQKQAEAIQACLREIGIELTIEAYDPPTAIPIYMQMGTAVMLGGTGGGNYDIAKYLSDSAADASNQGAAVKDEQYNEWLRTARYSMDEAERAECYANIQKWQAENYRWIPLNYPVSYTAYQNDIHNVMAFAYRVLYIYNITKD